MNPPKLIDQVRSTIRVKNHSPRTEEAYWFWIKRSILFHAASRVYQGQLRRFFETSKERKP